MIGCAKEEDTQVYSGFDISAGPYIAPYNVVFYNQSVNADTYSWDFGDGSSSDEIAPQHTYDAPGIYEVVLTASNSNSSKSYSRELIIKEAIPEITTPPASLGLDPFYTKYVDANGIPVISSDNVPDEALLQACNIINAMLEKVPEVKNKIGSYNGRVGIMGKDEVTTDIPEHAFLANDTTINWDERARGLGGTIYIPITTCAEENLLCYDLDPYHNEDILIHEFSHALHLMGLQFVYDDFNDRLMQAYNAALAAGLWINTYAAVNYEEYWAEGVQSWFNCNAESNPPNGIHNHVNTRDELKEYDRDLYDLLEEFFTSSQESISCHSY